ncbi:MAG TPA: ATP-binding protein [Anaerolineae bacterium]|nr:ATP-binding protein [Anaerolineae bacterium]
MAHISQVTRPFALLWGHTGSGKSHLAAAKFRQWWQLRGPFHYRHNPSPHWWDAASWLESMKEAYKSGENDAQRAVHASLLVIDDLGAERDTEWAVEQLGALLRNRYNERLPTVVTTNLNPDQLGKWEPRVASRLLGSDSLVIHLDVEDRRLASG